MSTAFNFYQEPVLPWSVTDTDRFFNRIVKIMLIIFLIISVIIPFLPVSKVEKKTLQQVSPRLAKLITEKRKEPPKPLPVQAKKKVEQPKVKKPDPKKQEQARKKAQNTGLMAMSREIDDLQSMFDLNSLATVKPLQTSESSKRPARSDATLDKIASKSSGGIDTSKLTRSTGKTKLAGRSSSQVASNIGDIKAEQTRHTSSGRNGRTEEEIQLVFDKNKGAINAIYHRLLRKDPTLQGKIVLELTIAPSGQVLKCHIVSTEVHNKTLESRLVARVMTFRFQAKDVETVTVTYPIDFLPS